MAGLRYDFTAFFAKEVKTFIRKYKSLITQKRGIDEDDAPRNEPSTAKRKGFNHWLVHTGELRRSGFESKAGRMEASIFASKKTHTSKYKNPPTFEDLFAWHTKKKKKKIFRYFWDPGSQFI